MEKKHNQYRFRANHGFSLLVALIFVSFFGAVLGTFVFSRSGENMRREAQITGWQAAEIARAARIYVRNQVINDPNLKYTLDIASGGPQEIDLSVLSSTGLLPADFANTRDGVRVTALSQEIKVYMANFPVDGNPTAEATVPTAYVVLLDNERSNAGFTQEIVEAIRRENVAIGAPVFDEDGNNLTGDCNGFGDTVGLWDTGCMGLAEYTVLTGDAVFTPGSLVIPAWRSVNFDNRILMRTPQPEMGGANTMLTELEMGDPDCANTITVPDDGSGTTELCGAFSDDISAGDVATADRRRDITGTRNLMGNSYISYSQSGTDVTFDNETALRRDAAVDEANSLDVLGDLTATGDLKAFEGNIAIGNTATIDRNVIVPTRSGQSVTANIGGVLTSNSMTSTDLEVFNTVSTSAPISANQAVVVPSASITNALATKFMRMETNGTVNVSQDADLLGDTNAVSTAITGGGQVAGYSYVTGNLGVQNLQVNGGVNVNDTVVVGGGSTIGRIDVTNGNDAQCAGDCPERIEFCKANGGALGFDCCMRNTWNDRRYVCVNDGS